MGEATAGWVDVRAVVLDVGETLVDETRAWTQVAHEVGVTPLALMGVLGALAERDEPHARVWEVLGVPRPATAATIEPGDLYPDALPALRALRRAGYVVGIAGNQPAGAEAQLRAAGADLDLVASSARWGVTKPDPAFFARLDHRIRGRRGRYLMLLTIVLWASLPAMAVFAGRLAGAICAVVLIANAAIMWRFRRRWT